MDKENHNCDNINCNHNNTKGLCCLFNPDNCKYRQLQKENAELKKEWQEQVQKANDEGYARTLQTMQLTNAKELLKWFVWYFREGSSNLVPYKHKVIEAEQFLKNSEVEK